MTAQHSAVGGSVASRVMHCPASVGLVEKVPAHLRRTSAYAERGTALHAAAVMAIEDIDNKGLSASLAGTTIGSYTISSEDIVASLAPVLAHVDALLVPGADFYLEQRVTFPGISNCFGTVDLLARIGRTVHVEDFKFGSGVRVVALRPDGDEDVINAQIAFYAAAARHTFPELFADIDNITLTILQPVSIEPDAETVSSVTITNRELDDFVTTYRDVCAEALSDAPRLARGDWCRFCPAKVVCPLHTAPLLDLAQFALPTSPSKAEYLKALAAGLELVDAVKDLGIALRDQAKAALQAGDVVPGFALSAGRAERDWRDENAAIAALIRAGFARADIIDETVRSPRQVELRAKARGLKIPSGLIGSHRSGVSLVRGENARAVVPGRGEIVRSFSEAIQAFQLKGGRQP
jgi:hypothetical protein